MSKAGASKLHVSTDNETKAIALQKLNIDVQLTILDLLSQTSPRSLLNVALSSRSLYHLSKSFIYRVLHFTFNPSRRNVNGRLIRQLLTDDDLSTKVQEIRVLWAPSRELQPGGGSKEDVDSLERALPRLTRLKTFIWDAEYPTVSGLLETLQEHHPQCTLFIRGDLARNLPRPSPSHGRLSIDVTLTSGQRQGSNTVPAIHDLTTNTASFFLAQLPGSLIPFHLRSLVLHQDSGFFEFSVIWSMLQRVSLDDSLRDQQIVPDFSCLKSLRLRVMFGEFLHLSNSLQECKKLEVLDLIGCTKNLIVVEDSFWESVGKTLIALRLHEPVQEWDTNRSLLSLNDMGRIVKNCRKLRSLGLDLACNGREWPYEMLQFIADEFCFIVHLELNISIENPRHDHPTSPKATLDSVPEIWKYLWQEITNSRSRRGHSITQPRLKSLDLKAGPKPPTAEPRKDYQQRFTFDLSARDDEARLGIAHVKCTELEALLSRLSTEEPLWTPQQDLIMKTAIDRARKGPHIRMPSVADAEILRPSSFWDRHDPDRFYHPPPP